MRSDWLIPALGLPQAFSVERGLLFLRVKGRNRFYTDLIQSNTSRKWYVFPQCCIVNLFIITRNASHFVLVRVCRLSRDSALASR